MKNYYIDKENHATAYLMPVESLGGWLLTGIDVHWRNRHRGVASALLKLITDDADNENITLFLAIGPDGSTGSLTAEQLIAWYSRNGFVTWHDNEDAMKRLPKSNIQIGNCNADNQITNRK